jgi:hypothetical protein
MKRSIEVPVAIRSVSPTHAALRGAPGVATMERIAALSG